MKSLTVSALTVTVTEAAVRSLLITGASQTVVQFMSLGTALWRAVALAAVATLADVEDFLTTGGLTGALT